MRRTTTMLRVATGLGLAVSLSLASMEHASVQAEPATVPSLVISQFKITSSNGQFVTLYNTTGSALDLSKYQLEYFNSYDLSKASSSKLIALSGTVPPHGYFIVNDGTLLLCYQQTVESASLGLSSTAGLVEVLAFSQAVPGSLVIPSLQDYVGWTKTAASGAQMLPANSSASLARRPMGSHNAPVVTTPGDGSWQAVQPDSGNPCNLVSVDAPNSPVALSSGQLLPPDQPPATIVSLAAGQSAVPGPPVVPPADDGLMSPVVNELLPNPTGTGNDATDEFIELYNPNSVTFDLSGFSLQTGTTSTHTYTFPASSGLPANSFTAYYASATGLSLSNSGGQVKLLDPTGKVTTMSDVYGAAGDGQVWALANGKWYWSGQPTPGAANVIKQATAKAKKSGKTAKAKKSTAGNSSVSGTGGVSSSSSSSGSSADTATVTPIHLWTLALVASLALLYVGYEYRTDLANRLWQLRGYFKHRRRPRP